MVASKRVPHALMFTGPDGGGTLAAAFVFARHLYCLSPAGDEPCGKCPSCVKISKLAHPDLHLVFPIIKTKTTGSYETSIYY